MLMNSLIASDDGGESLPGRDENRDLTWQLTVAHFVY